MTPDRNQLQHAIMMDLVSAGGSQRDQELKDALAVSKKAASVGSGTLAGTSSALVTFAAGSTLLPQHIAELVTSISLIARMSLKSSAFFIEVILEAAKYGTGMGLGLTRRALISAIGTARAAHALRNGEDWDPQTAGLAIEDGKRSGGALSKPRDAFLTILDRWTSLGIYVIHHSFTMAELFAMSGFYLVDAGIKAGVNAADESVRLIDGIFGSNETSRALSSFITLVRRELGNDEHFAALGGVRGVAALTKALTTFAVLQNATYKRTAKTQKTRVLYDCTVLGEAETKSWRAMIVGPGNFARREDPLALPDVPARGSSQRIMAGQGSGHGASAGGPSRPWSGSMRRMRSFYADEPCLTDVQSLSGYEAGSSAAPSSDPLDDELALLEDLDRIMGDEDDDGEIEEQLGGDGTIRSSHTMAMRHDELPETMRQAIGQAGDEELRRGLVINQRHRNSRHPRDVRRVVRKRGGDVAHDEVYEIITETVELVEETTTTTTMAAPEAPHVSGRKSSKPQRGLIPFTSGSSGSTRSSTHDGQGPPVPMKTSRNSYNSHADSKSETYGRGRRETTTAVEDEWLEVTRTTSSLGLDDLADGTSSLRGTDIPEVPNGRPASESIGALSRQETLQQSPEEGKQRMQVVLKTMTRKLIQKRRIVRRVKDDGSDVDEGGDSRGFEQDLGDSAVVALQKRFQPVDDDAPTGSDTDATRQPQRGGQKQGTGSNQAGSSLQRALQRARPAFLSPPSGKKTRAGASRDVGDQSDTTMRSSSRTATPSPPSTPPLPAKAALAPQRVESRALQVPAQAPAPPPKDRTSRFRTPKRRGRNGSISSMHSFSSAVTQTHVATSSSANREEEGPKGAPDAFPRQHLVKNLHTFMKHSSAAYGQAFMRILGLSEAQYVFGDTKKHHSNVYSYAHHCGLPLDNILLSSYAEEGKLPFHSEKMAPIVNYVSVDDEAKAVILTCRGTLGLSDMLTDLTCDYEDIEVEEGKPDGIYQVHSGMMAQAKRLSLEGSTVLDTLRRALQDRPDYGLVLTGHSLGGGVAALMGMLWASPSHSFKSQMLKLPASECPSHPLITTPFVTSLKGSLGVPGRPIKVYAYGPPCVSSIDLGTWSKGLVVSVVHGYDIVPALSLGLVRDLKSVATSLSDEREGDLAQEIVGRYVGLYQRRRKGNTETLEGSQGGAGLLANDDDAMAAISRPPDIPAHERQMTFDTAEIEAGKSRNRAKDASYQDPHLSSGPKDAGASAAEQSFSEPDEELSDWMWSLIRTMRAGMQNMKLYPPGQVYCVESFDIYVTPRTSNTSSTFQRSGSQATSGASEGEDTSAAQAHRVILRECGDVEARFSEPTFAKTMLRDHVPTNYSHCLELLHEAVIR